MFTMMRCAERDSLREQHRVAVHKFRTAIRHLVVLVDNSSANLDFNLAHMQVAATHAACALKRVALEHHQTEHGC
jgi:hypothetical protein